MRHISGQSPGHMGHRQAICNRTKGDKFTPKKAPLPESRVLSGNVFEEIGVDCCGPFQRIIRRQPGKPCTSKIWLILFICFKSKAIHIEILPDLTTDAFLGSLKMFCSVRGYPRKIHSDNGTNFVGAFRKLNLIHEFMNKHRGVLTDETENLRICWSFLPPRTPHMGGLWEANIKKLKQMLTTTYGKHPMTCDKWSICAKEIEGTLNSRPLVQDELGKVILSPGHFLIGRPI